MSVSPLHATIVDGGIWFLWAVLTCIDAVLVILKKIASFADVILADQHPQTKKKPRVVIVGASFAGLSAYRDMLRHGAPDEVDITVIDYKGCWFEYTPGILRCFVEPQYLSSLTCSLSALNNEDKGSRFIQGEVVGVNTDTNQVMLKSGKQIPFDYLVLATGSTYPGCIKATAMESTLSARQAQIAQSAKAIDKANTVVIVGGGAVGVELAAEIVAKYTNQQKRLVIIDMAKTILPGFREQSVQYAKKWLEENGVELRLDASLKHIDETSVTFADGSRLQAGVIFKCIGAAPASSFLEAEAAASRRGGGGLAQALSGPKGSIVVNDHLQVEGFDNIFCAGDACFHSESNELKLAHTAHVNASLVALNVLRKVRASTGGGVNSGEHRLLSYPKGLYGNDSTPKIYNISLGKYDASLGFNSLVINGPLSAVVKWLIEWTQVAAAANRPVGLLFWVVADWASFFLGRTILPAPSSRRSKKSQ